MFWDIKQSYKCCFRVDMCIQENKMTTSRSIVWEYLMHSFWPVLYSCLVTWISSWLLWSIPLQVGSTVIGAMTFLQDTAYVNLFVREAKNHTELLWCQLWCLNFNTKLMHKPVVLLKAGSSCFQYQMLLLQIKKLRKYFYEEKTTKPVGPNTVYIHRILELLYWWRVLGRKLGVLEHYWTCSQLDLLRSQYLWWSLPTKRHPVFMCLRRKKSKASSTV